MQPKILLFDLETSPSTVYTWELYEADALKVIKPWQIMCIAYKWLGEKKTHVLSYNQTGKERDLVDKLWDLFDEADIVIAHNGDKFDIRKTNAKFIRFGLKPPTPYKTIDTLKVARKYFRFDSNRLDALGEYLNLGRKIKTGGFDLWDRCLQGDESAWKRMERYNRQDVILLEKIYLKLRPYIKNHPNIGLIKEDNSCPNCGSKKLQKRGFAYSRTNKYQRWQCLHCFSWHQSPANGVIR